MLSPAQRASSTAFTRAVVRALDDSSFSPPVFGEVQVVVCHVGGWASTVSSARELLNATEYARSVRWRFDRDRSTYILAHALWRVILGISLDVGPTEVPLTSTAAGQPLLPGSGFSTSLSHSGGWVAIAVCGSVAVGIDIEQSPTRATLAALMPTICAPDEIVDMQPLSPPDREAALLALWTRKEALLKAFGVGLGADPSRLSARANQIVAPPPSSSHQTSCHAVALEMPDGVVGAVAIPECVATVRLCSLRGFGVTEAAMPLDGQSIYVI